MSIKTEEEFVAYILSKRTPETTIRLKAKELARLMYDSANTIPVPGWPGQETTYFYLPTEHHTLYRDERGFGMKKSITLRKGERPTMKELENAIVEDWNK